MKPQITLLLFSFSFLLPFPTSSSSSSSSQDDYTDCTTKLFNCGPIRDLAYPFWGGDRPNFCGPQQFELHCHDDDGEYPTIRVGASEYRVLNVTDQTIRIARTDLWDGVCPSESDLTNTTIDYAVFGNSASSRNLSLFYNCSLFRYSVGNNFSCAQGEVGYYADESLVRIGVPGTEKLECSAGIEVPVLSRALDQLAAGNETLEEAVKQGFDLIYFWERSKCSLCESSNGVCGYNLSSPSRFLCVCPDGHFPHYCPPLPSSSASAKNSINWEAKLGIGFGTAFVCIAIMLLLFYLYLRRKRTKEAASLLSRDISSSSVVVDFEKEGHHSLGVHLFSYYELEEATNNFDSARELGDGGFGTVYYGNLKDGRSVAVKRLYEHNFKRVEQFLNEVEILTRLRHTNLVSLYGCTSRHCRELLLVYEYVSNGTVADHLHGGNLPWPTRIKIALETATALSYLHASEIIHRDVKTNNILLDDHFCVKVADFGLSRLFPTDVTHVSTAPQGTPGYVDPDYHQCYQLTVKSDVYSFGVVLVELVSSKPAVDITRHRHEINLSSLAINKIQSKALHELVDPSLGYDSDRQIRATVDAVAELAFGCLQGDKDLRPSMAEVAEALRRIHCGESSPDSVIMNWSTCSSDNATPG